MQGETLAQIIRYHANTADNRPFLTLVHDGTPDQSFSYGELYRLQCAWARQFTESGLRQGNTVVVILPHSDALYGALGGALLMGAVPAVYAFPSSKLSSERYFSSLDTLLIQCKASLIVAYPALAVSLREFLADSNLQIPVIESLEACSTVEYAIQVPLVRPDDVAFLQYSSGTTGLKKGVAVTHRALLWQIRAYSETIALTPGDVIASWLPLYHDMGLIACFMLPWLTRTPLVAMSPFSWVKRPEMLLDKIHEYRATLCWQPNFAYLHIANRIAEVTNRVWDLSSVRMFINCSEPITEASHTRFLSVLEPTGLSPECMGSCYAMAENTFAISNTSPGKSATIMRRSATEFEQRNRIVNANSDETVRVCVSSGVPLDGVSVEIRDERGNILEDMEIGEVAISAPCLFSGYQMNSEATQTAMRDGFFYTGDLGFFRHGELFITGRKKDIIIVAGKNIYPQDIEELVEQTAGVIAGRCVAFGLLERQRGTEKVIVVAETSLYDSAEANRVRADISLRVNSAIDISIDEILLVKPGWLLKSTSGKLSRELNRKKYVEEKKTDNIDPDGSSNGGDSVLRILKSVLPKSVRSIPLSDSTRLIAGGFIDSMTLTGLMLAIERRFSLSLSGEFLDAFMADDRLPVLRRLIEKSILQKISSNNSGNDWNEQSFARFVAGDNKRKFHLAPQLADANNLGAKDDTQFGRISTANYRSRTLNTDESGFRCTMLEGKTLPWAEFRNIRRQKGVVLGNSVAFGVGVSADDWTLASQLNNGVNGSVWYNLSLRRSNVRQEFAALKKHYGCSLSHVVWLSGVNDLKFLLVDITNAIQGMDAQKFSLSEAVWWTNYKKFKIRFTEVMREVNDYRLTQNISLVFALQPTINWVGKKLTAEELFLVNDYDCSFNMLLRRVLTSVITPLYEDYSSFLRKTCESFGFFYIDFNRHPAINVAEEWVFMDRLHLGDKGHCIIAKTIDEIL